MIQNEENGCLGKEQTGKQLKLTKKPQNKEHNPNFLFFLKKFLNFTRDSHKIIQTSMELQSNNIFKQMAKREKNIWSFLRFSCL